jgi:hypothetical protein
MPMRILASHAVDPPCPQTGLHPMKASKTIDAAKFDSGADISEHVDWSKARRPGLEKRRVGIDFPAWLLAALDRQAKRLGVSRQALITMRIAERVGRPVCGPAVSESQGLGLEVAYLGRHAGSGKMAG